MKTISLVVLLLGVIALSSAKVFFSEDFNDKSWEKNWVLSKNKGESAGDWKHTAGEFYLNEDDKGIQTGTDYRFYQISRVFDSFSNEDDTLVLQFSVKHEQKLDCGGGYIKLLPAGFDQENFSGDTPYYIMFGPDICGGTKRTHLIFNYKGENFLIQDNLPVETDVFTHVYTLILNPDQTYKFLIDNVEKKTGSLVEDWGFLPPKKIPDPNQSKPADWVDERLIKDPSAVKPDGWDDIPALIPDTDATIPDDWDTELDGDWEAPLVPNPDYQGEWEHPLIENPDYKGPWVHPEIDNPDYFTDDKIYAYKDIAAVGIEIWQVKAGSIFDNILVTNDVKLASDATEKILKVQEAEKAKHAEQESAKAAEEEEQRLRLEEEFGEGDEHDAHVHEEL